MKKKYYQISFDEVQLEIIAKGIRKQMDYVTSTDVDKKNKLAKTLAKVLRAQEKIDPASLPKKGDQ